MYLAEGIIAAVVALLVVITVLRSVRIIPQARARNVERFGRYRKTLEPGMNFIIPGIDRVKKEIDLREQVVSFTGAPVITEDNLSVLIDTVLFFQVTDPRAADYEIVNYIQAIEQITATMLRSVIGSMDLEKTLTSRDHINNMLRGVLDDASGKWGIRVTRVEIKAIDPPKSVKDAMEKQMRAEREKRAAILTAEGVKASKILTAEGEKQSAILTAEGAKQSAILRAEGQAQAIGAVFQAVHDNDPDPKLLAYQYLQTLPQLAQGQGNTFWVIPSEVTSALRSVASAFGGGDAAPAGDNDDRAGDDRAEDRGPARAARRPRGPNRRRRYARPGSRPGSRCRRDHQRCVGRCPERHAGGRHPRNEFRRSAGRDRASRHRGRDRRGSSGRRSVLGQRQRSGLRDYFSSRTSALPISAAMTMTASSLAGKYRSWRRSGSRAAACLWGTSVLDGPVLNGPVLNGPVLNGPVLTGPVLTCWALAGWAGTVAVRCAGSATGRAMSAAAVHEVRVTVGSSARGVAAGMRRSAGACGSGWPQKSVCSLAARSSA
jgi:regulator of protease activity HflC (stomatin/prohibitin superfamily)